MNTMAEKKEPDGDKSFLIPSQQIEVKFMSKLQEVDGLYKKSLQEYRQGLQRYSMEIKALKNEIELIEEVVRAEEKNIFLVESSFSHDKKLLEKLHAKLFQKIDSLYELQHEYKKLLDSDKFEESTLRKEQDIEDLLIEIEESELSLLNKELERLNLASLLAPKEKALKGLKLKMETIEAQKQYFESSELGERTFLLENSEVIEDAEVVDKLQE